MSRVTPAADLSALTIRRVGLRSRPIVVGGNGWTN